MALAIITIITIASATMPARIRSKPSVLGRCESSHRTRSSISLRGIGKPGRVLIIWGNVALPGILIIEWEHGPLVISRELLETELKSAQPLMNGPLLLIYYRALGPPHVPSTPPPKVGARLWLVLIGLWLWVRLRLGVRLRLLPKSNK